MTQEQLRWEVLRRMRVRERAADLDALNTRSPVYETDDMRLPYHAANYMGVQAVSEAELMKLYAAATAFGYMLASLASIAGEVGDVRAEV